jgi:hypothetical protein
MNGLQNPSEIITAVGGLGTAAFGLVDAAKALLGPINRIGFQGIKKVVLELTPGPQADALSQQKVLATLEANWINGTDLGSQKAIAKSLIKLNLSAANAQALAAATSVDSDALKAVAGKIASGTALDANESDVFARFDLIVIALLDEAYQRSDQVYRNSTRFLAMLVSIALAVVGGMTLHTEGGYWTNQGADLGKAFLVGLLATPLAPIAKDLSTALATAVNTLQLVRK